LSGRVSILRYQLVTISENAIPGTLALKRNGGVRKEAAVHSMGVDGSAADVQSSKRKDSALIGIRKDGAISWNTLCRSPGS